MKKQKDKFIKKRKRTGNKKSLFSQRSFFKFSIGISFFFKVKRLFSG